MRARRAGAREGIRLATTTAPPHPGTQNGIQEESLSFASSEPRCGRAGAREDIRLAKRTAPPHPGTQSGIQ